MAEKYKGLFIFLIIFIIGFDLTGCRISSPSSPTAVATKQANVIFECLISKDADALKELFVPTLQNDPELDAQIMSFFNFVDGEIISYSKPGGEQGSLEVRDGKTVYQGLQGHTYDIETDAGKKYEIRHSAIKVNDRCPDELGVYYICIVDKDLFTAAAGYPESGIARIGDSLFKENQ